MEHVADIDDLTVAKAIYEADCKQWPGANITLRQGVHFIEDSRKPRLTRLREYAIRSDRDSRQNAVSDPSAHAAARLRLCPGQRRPRHAFPASLAGAQEYPAHGALYGVGTGSVQGFLAIENGPATRGSGASLYGVGSHPPPQVYVALWTLSPHTPFGCETLLHAYPKNRR